MSDDHRQKIAEIIYAGIELVPGSSFPQGTMIPTDYYDAADALIAAGLIRETDNIGNDEYGHEYYDFDGTPHVHKVTAAEFAEHKPDGHRTDGSPYWNYTQVTRRKASKWVPQTSQSMVTPSLTERVCACGWRSHEKPENAREFDRSWEVHESFLCPLRPTGDVADNTGNGLLNDVLSWASDDEGHMPDGLAEVLEPHLDPESSRLTYAEMESERDRLASEIYRIGTRIENDLADYKPDHDFRKRGLEHALEIVREESGEPSKPVLSEVLDALANIVSAATEYGEKEGGFVAYYIIPTGPLHRAIPLLQSNGIRSALGLARSSGVADTVKEGN